MKKQILINSVAIALMLLAIIPTASSDANGGGNVWSDGYVELTLNKMERVNIPPMRQIGTPKEGYDFVIINLTFTRINECRHVVITDWFYRFFKTISFETRVLKIGGKSILFDGKGDKYTDDFVVQGEAYVSIIPRYENGELATANDFDSGRYEYHEAVKGSEWLLIFEIPEDKEPVRLKFIYPFIESWEKRSIKEGQIEIDLQVTPTPIPTLTPIPSPTPIPSSPTTTKIPTLEEKGVHGFGAIFAIAGLLAVAYLLRRRR